MDDPGLHHPLVFRQLIPIGRFKIPFKKFYLWGFPIVLFSSMKNSHTNEIFFDRIQNPLFFISKKI